MQKQSKAIVGLHTRLEPLFETLQSTLNVMVDFNKTNAEQSPAQITASVLFRGVTVALRYVAGVADQVNSSVTEIAATAKEQQATASETAATVSEIGATSSEIAATSRELVKMMSEVSSISMTTLPDNGHVQTVRKHRSPC